MKVVKSQDQFDNMEHVSNMMLDCYEITITKNSDIPLMETWDFKRCPIVKYKNIEHMRIPRCGAEQMIFIGCKYVKVRSDIIRRIYDCHYSTFDSCLSIEDVSHCEYCKIDCGFIKNTIDNCKLCNINYTAHSKTELIRDCHQCTIELNSDYGFIIPRGYIVDCSGCDIIFNIDFIICSDIMMVSCDNLVITARYIMKDEQLADTKSKNITIKTPHIYCKEKL